jgi:hypothetical protein
MLMCIVDAFHRLYLQPEGSSVVQGSTSKVGKFETLVACETVD